MSGGAVLGRALQPATAVGDRISIATNCFNPPVKA
jgi:hypothetical protein